jgi:hypothetical protein
MWKCDFDILKGPFDSYTLLLVHEHVSFLAGHVMPCPCSSPFHFVLFNVHHEPKARVSTCYKMATKNKFIQFKIHIEI